MDPSSESIVRHIVVHGRRSQKRCFRSLYRIHAENGTAHNRAGAAPGPGEDNAYRFFSRSDERKRAVRPVGRSRYGRRPSERRLAANCSPTGDPSG